MSAAERLAQTARLMAGMTPRQRRHFDRMAAHCLRDGVFRHLCRRMAYSVTRVRNPRAMRRPAAVVRLAKGW